MGYIGAMDPWDLDPPHEARSPIDELVVSMKRDGWQDRPLLIGDDGESVVAITGSHRIAAAREAGLPAVPCYFFDLPDSASWAVELRSATTDRERLVAISKSGDAGAISLMWAENRV